MGTADLRYRGEGSSPRMRGSRRLHRERRRQNGIIPAHAGLTACGTPMASAARDHPRACGAHPRPPCRGYSCPGSSPRMRGSLSAFQSTLTISRIIPAHAGLTSRNGNAIIKRRDHPRACGAHRGLYGPAVPQMGSSPRMRGSRHGRDGLCPWPGIIPAHAGLTRLQAQGKDTRWDHPRACGAHLDLLRRHVATVGSSPRMRGSLQRGPRYP